MEDIQSIDADAVLWSAPYGQRQGRPHLVAMHGYGADEADLYGLVAYFPRELVIASLRAPRREGPGFAWFPARTHRHNSSSDQSVEVAVRAVLSWLDLVELEPPVGLLGFSQGGSMAIELMRHCPSRFSYAVVLSGFLTRDERPGDVRLLTLRPPVFWGRGQLDAAISSQLIERTAKWLPEHSTLDMRVYEQLGHAISDQELSDVDAFIKSQL